MTAAKEITNDSMFFFFFSFFKVWLLVAAVVSARAQCLLFGK